MTSSACRIDVWLWRARFFKSRALAADFIGQGRIRAVQAGQEVRIDKVSRTVRPGDALTFVLGGRVIAITVTDIGVRRGPAAEARLLYSERRDEDP